jgi:hypothetical protein
MANYTIKAIPYTSAALMIVLVSALAGGCSPEAETVTETQSPPNYNSLIRRVGYLIQTGRPADYGNLDSHRRYLIRDLGDTRDPAALSCLRSVLFSEYYTNTERGAAAGAIVKIGPDDAFDLMKKAIDEEVLCQSSGISVMGSLMVLHQDKNAYEYIRKMLRHSDAHVRYAAATTFHSDTRALPEEVVAVLKNLASVESTGSDSIEEGGVAVSAGVLLVAHGYEEYWPMVQKAARMGSEEIRDEIITDIPLNRKGMDILLVLLGDPAIGVRWSVYERFEKELTPFLDDPNPIRSPPLITPDNIEQQRALYRKAWKARRDKIRATPR